MSMSAFWCFTINNPLADPVFADVKYLVYQVEEETTVHIQGYVIFNTRKRFETVKNMVPTAHIEPRRGTHSEAKAYCMKLETRVAPPVEFGDDSDVSEGQGKRNDLAEIYKRIQAGDSELTICEAYPATFMRTVRGINYVRALVDKRCRTVKTIVNYYYGISGSGKSFRAKLEAGPDAYWKDPGNKWFDGYVGQEHVIFDDFRGNWFFLGTLLRILDQYPLKVEPKGEKSVPFLATTIWITSNIPPDQLYPNCSGVELQALLRRIEHVVHFTEAFILPVVIE